jgi:hypothetical protein
MLEVQELSEKLTAIAREGGDECERDKCMVFYGTVLDMARKLRIETAKFLQQDGI